MKRLLSLVIALLLLVSFCSIVKASMPYKYTIFEENNYQKPECSSCEETVLPFSKYIRHDIEYEKTPLWLS